MKYLKIKNWENFQHYKDRCPPWIKLHRDLLRNYDFLCLQDASKLHLMLIWLLASQMDNRIPADSEFIKKQIGVTDDIDFKELINKGFLIDDSDTLATCKQSAMLETEAETETKTETESNKGRKNFKKPTVEEIRNYCRERNNDINPENFYDHYESNGWLVGKNKMKDWKASVRTWERRNNNKGTYTNSSTSYAPDIPL